MSHPLYARLAHGLDDLRAAGLLKDERVIASHQGPEITLADGRKALNLCANNYLGLSGHPALLEAARAGLQDFGYGLSSVRFICGTQTVHRALEERVADYLGTQDAILFGSCFDANGGLFEALLGEEDAILSDELNHASIIDGARLSKAKRFRYRNNDPEDLERKLREAPSARVKLVVTDGVFSMDGIIADLHALASVARRHDALIMVDDSHAVGVLGAHGRGTPEHSGTHADILTGTFGKSLGGASGGYVAARREIVSWLRQKARPYLFSNTLAPAIAAATLKAIDLSEHGNDLRVRLMFNAGFFRDGLQALGFDLVPGEHAIIPVLIGDARTARDMSARLLEEGVYAVAFSHPVVPEGKARIRVQMSAAHTREQLQKGLSAFERAGKGTGLIR